MSNNGMNYPWYNNLTYPHIVQQPFLYNQPPQYNSYDHIVQSTAETLAAFTHPSEQVLLSNPPRRSNTKTYYCEICRVGCGGQTSYQAHLNGTKHKKKESNTLIQQSNSKTFRCELCDITCTSSDAYQAHLDGSKHDRAMKLHRKLGKAIPESQINPSLEDKQTTDTNCSFIGMEYIETSHDTSNNVKSFFCKLCNCKFHDINGRDAHLKGKRHRLSYKKKVNPNFQVDSQVKPTEVTTEHIQPIHSSPPPSSSLPSSDIDNQTKLLMNFHERIIPNQYQREKIEEFIHLVETTLKSCSDRIATLNNQQSLIMGVSRVDLFVKNLLIKTDRIFQLVVICFQWPKRKLLEDIVSLFNEHLPSTWQGEISTECQPWNELIQINGNTDVGQLSIVLSFTTPTIQQTNQESLTDEFLSQTNCLKAFYAMESVRWFQNQLSKRPYALPLVRCLRYKATTLSNWQGLSSEIIEILIEQILSKSASPLNAFRQVLEYLSGGLVLSNNPSLRTPWINDPSKGIFDSLNTQQRNNITFESQNALRLMSFGQLNIWLDKCDNSQVTKRLYSDLTYPNAAKRLCTELMNHQSDH